MAKAQPQPQATSRLHRTRVDFDVLNKQLAEAGGKKDYTDPRYWQPTIDKAGNGYAVIRFLPTSAIDLDLDEKAPPFVKTFSHGFKHNGKWYIENCPTTIGGECPVCEGNNELWNTNIEANQDIARDRKRKLRFTSNILVINDPEVPDNNGKVFLYSYPKKVYTKIMDLANPTFAEDQKVKAFDLWEGLNFKLRIVTVAKFLNYDKAEFDRASIGPIAESDEAKEKIWDAQYSLAALVAPTEYKPYEDLKKRYLRILGEPQQKGTTSAALHQEVSQTPEPSPSVAASKFADVEDDASESPDDIEAHFRKFLKP